MALEVPAERVHEGRGLRGRAFDFRQGKRSRLAPGGNARRTLGLANDGEEVARRARGARELLGQADAECALDTQDQLGSRQAVESEIAVDRVVEAHHPRARTRPQLLEHRRDQPQQALGVFVRRRRRPRCAIRSQHGNPDGRPCTRRRPRTAPTVSRIVGRFEFARGFWDRTASGCSSPRSGSMSASLTRRRYPASSRSCPGCYISEDASAPSR